uniref:Uncharacterized protein n=1 Tax=Rhizophora mucronata TaxID=61149 RepID=A0A2P2J2G8_RHIMU
MKFTVKHLAMAGYLRSLISLRLLMTSWLLPLELSL